VEDTSLRWTTHAIILHIGLKVEDSVSVRTKIEANVKEEEENTNSHLSEKRLHITE
jgi:hypothetical protein